MDWHSTNRISGSRIAVLVLIAFCGCRTQSTSMSNPFMSPDRVPPPSTRVIAPGTAQPYYPGDPLPSVQGAVPPPPTGAVAAAPTLPPLPPNQPPITPIGVDAPPTNQVALGNDRSVAIPTDEENLRFALPPPPAPTPLQPTSATPGVAATQPPPAVAPTSLAPMPAAASAVAPAVFSQEAAGQIPATPSGESASSGTWRSPQRTQNGGAVQASLTAPAAMSAAAPQSIAPPAAPASTMPVQLRAVTPPPNTQVLQPVYNPPPRMRFPNFFGSSQPEPTPAMAAVPQPMPVAPQSTAPTSPDGFRPRGSVH